MPNLVCLVNIGKTIVKYLFDYFEGIFIPLWTVQEKDHNLKQQLLADRTKPYKNITVSPLGLTAEVFAFAFKRSSRIFKLAASAALKSGVKPNLSTVSILILAFNNDFTKSG